MRFCRTKNRLIVKRESYFLGGVLMAGVMAIGGLFLITGLLPFEEGYTVADVFGFVFVCLWEAFVVCAILWYAREHSKYMVISAEGIRSCTCFKKAFVAWDDVRDWGISYCGQTRWKGNTYFVYFSKEEHPVQNECKKKLKGNMLKTFVYEEDYGEAVNILIPFCADKTDVAPFVGKDRYHFM